VAESFVPVNFGFVLGLLLLSESLFGSDTGLFFLFHEFALVLRDQVIQEIFEAKKFVEYFQVLID
jgi:hypothetical protein